MSITVYTKPSCVQCNATKRALVKAGLAYEEVDLTLDADALEAVKAFGLPAGPRLYLLAAITGRDSVRQDQGIGCGCRAGRSRLCLT